MQKGLYTHIQFCNKMDTKGEIPQAPTDACGIQQINYLMSLLSVPMRFFVVFEKVAQLFTKVFKQPY